MNSFIRRIYKHLTLFVACLIVLVAIILSFVRVLTPILVSHQQVFAVRLSKTFKQPIKIENIETAWDRFEPVIRLHNVVFLNKKTQQPEVVIGTVDFGINLWRSILKWELEPGLIAINSTKISATENNKGEVIIEGIEAIPPFRLSGQNIKSDFLKRISNIGKIDLENIAIDWHKPSGQIIVINNLNFIIRNANEIHKMWGSFDVIQNKPAHINFSSHMVGNLTKQKSLDVALYLNVKNLPISPGLTTFAWRNFSITEGEASFETWINWRKGQLFSVQTKIKNLPLEIKQKINNNVLQLQQVFGDVTWRRLSEGGWELYSQNLQINFADQAWPRIQFYFKVPTKGSQHKQRFYISYVHLGSLQPFLQNWPEFPVNVQKLLERVKPEGDIRNLLIVRAPVKNNNYSVSAQFNNISLDAWQHIPALRGLSGKTIFNEMGGILRVDSQQLQADFPEIFNNPLSFSRVQSQIVFQKQNEGWQVQVSPFYATSADLVLRGEIKLFLKPKTTPEINAIFGLQNFNVAKLANYLPSKKLSHKLNKWLMSSIKSGQSRFATIIMRGPLNAFPYDHHEGVFSVNADFNNAILVYNPHWPPVTQLNGILHLTDRQMNIQVHGGKTANMSIQSATAKIPYIGHKIPAIVLIDGQLKGELGNALQFLETSPLRNRIGKNLHNMQLQGPMSILLHLNVPTKHTKGNVKASGVVTTQQATLTLANWNLKLTNVAGQLNFTQTNLSGKNITGTLFDYPVTFNIDTQTTAAKKAFTTITGIGQADFHLASQHFHVPVADYIHGVSFYRILLQLRHSETENNSLMINSNLIGTAITLPSPLNKAANSPSDLKILLNFNGDAPLKIHFNYANLTNGALSFVKTKGLRKFSGGEIQFGETPANFQTKPGLLIGGNLSTFTWSEWFPFIRDMTREQKASNKTQVAQTNEIQFVNVMIRKINIFNQQLFNTHVQLSPILNGWLMRLEGENISGQVHIPKNFANHLLWANLTKLHLQPSNKTSKGSSQFRPQDLPAMQIYIADLRSGKVIYGETYIQTIPLVNGMRINKLIFNNSKLRLSACGFWMDTKTGTQTNLMGSYKTNNLMAALQSWQIPSSIDSNFMLANFALHWPGAPYAMNLAKLSGRVSISMGQGRIVDLSQEAQADLSLGRLLTLLSLQSLPRRLTLNFSDLFHKGYSFDCMRGDFKINNGVASTENTSVVGVVANINVKGNIDLAEQNFELLLKITPHVTSSLPVLATLIGGPVAGVATFVVNQLLSHAVNKMTTRYYSLTGPWHNPRVKQLKVTSNLNKNIAAVKIRVM